MESENGYWDEFISKETSSKEQRAVWIIISWINGETLLHTDKIKPDCIKDEEGSVSYINLDIVLRLSLFIDINKQLLKLSFTEIDIKQVFDMK